MSDTPLSTQNPEPPGTGGILKALVPRGEYFAVTRTLTYSYIFVLPLIVLYEIGVLLVNPGTQNQIRVSADIFIKRILGFVGIDGTLFVSAFILAVGAAIVLYERRHKIAIKPKYFAFMLGESLTYGIAIGMFVAWFVAELFAITWPPLLQMAGRISTSQALVLSLGAGIYEELVFRLLLVSALVWALRLIKPIDERKRYIIAAVIGALIFSAVHYIGAYGDPFGLQSFTFRFLMGLALNALFLWRGFGIAAMTHALYDVFVVLMNGG